MSVELSCPSRACARRLASWLRRGPDPRAAAVGTSVRCRLAVGSLETLLRLVPAVSVSQVAGYTLPA